jgi:hypothetical protein
MLVLRGEAMSVDADVGVFFELTTSSIKNSPTPLRSAINFDGNSAVLDVISLRNFDGVRVRPDPILSLELVSSLIVLAVLRLTVSLFVTDFFEIATELLRLFSFDVFFGSPDE